MLGEPPIAWSKSEFYMAVTQNASEYISTSLLNELKLNQSVRRSVSDQKERSKSVLSAVICVLMIIVYNANDNCI